MLNWSKRNYLHFSTEYGWLLWAGNTGSIVKISEDLHKKLCEGQECGVYNCSPEITRKLIDIGALHEETNDEYDNKLLYTSNGHRYDSSHLMLTIAITSVCNFKCDYCIEEPVLMNHQQEMSFEICDALVKYIEHTEAKNIHLMWYGGEPLTAFRKIVYITEQLALKQIDVTHEVTSNGYLLSKEVVDYFSNRRWTAVQVTVDGTESVHNSRRAHRSNNDSYARIIENLDYLYSKVKDSHNPIVSVRVNIDKRNRQALPTVKAYFDKRYKGRFTVYLGFVCERTDPFGFKNNDSNSFVHSVVLNKSEQNEYVFDLFNQHKIIPFFSNLRYLKPRVASCSANFRNSYVIDWDGNAVKCWNHLGDSEFTIFNVQKKGVYNLGLEARYVESLNFLNDKQCLACPLLLTCGGGCSCIRDRTNLDRANEMCNLMLPHFGEYLEMSYASQHEKSDQMEKRDG
jgi:uncharacterized protein